MFLFSYGNAIVKVPFKIQNLHVNICAFVSSGVLFCGLLYHYLVIFKIDYTFLALQFTVFATSGHGLMFSAVNV